MMDRCVDWLSWVVLVMLFLGCAFYRPDIYFSFKYDEFLDPKKDMPPNLSVTF